MRGARRCGSAASRPARARAESRGARLRVRVGLAPDALLACLAAPRIALRRRPSGGYIFPCAGRAALARTGALLPEAAQFGPLWAALGRLAACSAPAPRGRSVRSSARPLVRLSARPLVRSSARPLVRSSARPLVRSSASSASSASPGSPLRSDSLRLAPARSDSLRLAPIRSTRSTRSTAPIRSGSLRLAPARSTAPPLRPASLPARLGHFRLAGPPPARQLARLLPCVP